MLQCGWYRPERFHTKPRHAQCLHAEYAGSPRWPRTRFHATGEADRRPSGRKPDHSTSRGAFPWILPLDTFLHKDPWQGVSYDFRMIRGDIVLLVVGVAGVFLQIVIVSDNAHAEQQHERQCQPSGSAHAPDGFRCNDGRGVAHYHGGETESQAEFPPPMHQIERSLPSYFGPGGEDRDDGDQKLKNVDKSKVFRRHRKGTYILRRRCFERVGQFCLMQDEPGGRDRSSTSWRPRRPPSLCAQNQGWPGRPP